MAGVLTTELPRQPRAGIEYTFAPRHLKLEITSDGPRDYRLSGLQNKRYLFFFFFEIFGRAKLSASPVACDSRRALASARQKKAKRIILI